MGKLGRESSPITNDDGKAPRNSNATKNRERKRLRKQSAIARTEVEDEGLEVCKAITASLNAALDVPNDVDEKKNDITIRNEMKYENCSSKEDRYCSEMNDFVVEPNELVMKMRLDEEHASTQTPEGADPTYWVECEHGAALVNNSVSNSDDRASTRNEGESEHKLEGFQMRNGEIRPRCHNRMCCADAQRWFDEYLNQHKFDLTPNVGGCRGLRGELDQMYRPEISQSHSARVDTDDTSAGEMTDGPVFTIEDCTAWNENSLLPSNMQDLSAAAQHFGYFTDDRHRRIRLIRISSGGTPGCKLVGAEYSSDAIGDGPRNTARMSTGGHAPRLPDHLRRDLRKFRDDTIGYSGKDFAKNRLAPRPGIEARA